MSCINTNLSEYQTLKKRSGLSDFILKAVCRTFMQRYDRFPHLDELPDVNSESALREELGVKSDGSAKIEDILQATGKETIEEAIVNINDEYRDLSTEIIPLHNDAIVDIVHRPTTELDIREEDGYNTEEINILKNAPRNSEGKLLAPNGRVSNLSEKLYVQVRTRTFKKWFGDWEKINAFALSKVNTDKVDIIVDPNRSKTPGYVNQSLKIYLKGQPEKGYFELVKDNEFGQFSVHFKTSTEKTGSLTTSSGETSIPSTSAERAILWEQLINAIPEGATVSTWGELSEDGIAALNKFGRKGSFVKIGERTVNKKESIGGGEINIPVWQKGEGVSKVVDENGEPMVVYHGGAKNISIFKTANLLEDNTTGKEFYTDKTTGEKIEIDSNNTIFFSDNPYTALSYAQLFTIKQIYKIRRKIDSLINTLSGTGGGFSKNEFKSFEGLLNTLEELIKYNPRYSKLIEYLIKNKNEGKKLKSHEVKAFRDLLFDTRKILESISEWSMNNAEWNFLLDTSYNILNQYNSTLGVRRLIKGEIPEYLKKEHQLFELIQKDRENNGLYKVMNYEDNSLPIVSLERTYEYIHYDGKDLYINDKKVSEYSEEELLSKIQESIELNRVSKARYNNSNITRETSDRAQVYQVFLNLKNPLTHDYKGTMQGQGYRQSLRYSFGYVAARQVRRALLDNNDGVIFQNLYDPYLANNYGVFNSNQIKSVDNQGEFSDYDEEIYDSLRPLRDIQTPSNPVIFSEIISSLSRLYGIKINTISDLELASEKWKDVMPDDRLVNAFVYNGEIYLNVNRCSIDSPIHEMMHLLIGGLRFSDTLLYINLLLLAENLPNYGELLQQYQGKTRNDINEELFVTEVAKYVTGQPSLIDLLPLKYKYEIHYNMRRVLDSILMGRVSTNIITDSELYFMSLRELSQTLKSDTFTLTDATNLRCSELHRKLNNTKSDLIKKGELMENCE